MIRGIQRATAIAGLVMLAAAGGCDDGTGGTPSVAKVAHEAASAATPTIRLVSDADPRSDVSKNPAGWPPVEFQPPQLDFGVVEPDSMVEGTSRIWNVGRTPLRVTRSITSCGCTDAEDLSGRVIDAGGFIEFKTAMEIKSGLGEKKEKVTVFFEGYSDREAAIFFFTALASRAVQASPPHITALKDMTGEVELTSRDGKPFTVLASQARPPVYVGFDPATDPPQSRYTLRWDLTREHQESRVPWFWIIETDHPEAPVIDLRIRHANTKPNRPRGRTWVPKDQRVLIDNVRAGEAVEVMAKIEYSGNHTPEPRTAKITGETGQVDAELIEAHREGQFIKYRIRVTPRPGPPQLLYEEILLHASGHTTPLRLIGRRVE